jgi:outer membrane protein
MLNSLKHYFFSITILTTSVVSAQNLDDIYQQVLQADPGLLIESLTVEVDATRERQAFGALLPQISLGSSWTENKQLPEGLSKQSYSGERYNLSVSQPLIDMPKYYSWKQSEALSGQSVFKQKENASLTKLNMIERYFNVLNATDELALSRETRAATEKKVEHIRALYKMQRVKVTDLLEVEARLDMLASKEIDAMQETEKARGGLGELTNSKIEYISPLKKAVDYIERVEDINEWTIVSVAKSYRLMAFQKAIDAAQRNVDKKSSGHYPTLGLRLNKQKSNIGYESASTRPTITEVATLQLSIPIYSGGVTSARTYEAIHQLEIAQLRYEQEKRKLIKQSREMFLGLNAIITRIEAAKQAVKSSRKSYKAMKRSFELEIATVTDLLEEQRLFSMAKRLHQRALYDYITAKARLFHLSGKLDEGFIYKINDWLI